MLQVAMLPLWEMFLYLLLSFGFHFYSFYEVYKVSREYEEELEREFELEKDTLFWGLKKDPTDFEWTFWMEWGKERIIWLLLGHLMVSQMSRLFTEKYQPWCLMAYGMVACWLLLGINGLTVLLLHIAISFSVAQFQTAVLTWLCSLLLLSALRVPALEEAMRGWYDSENEYYLLLFTLTVRCLYYTSFSLEYCWHGSTQKRYHSFFWMLAYMFYYPVFHNGPIMTFNEFTKQRFQLGGTGGTDHAMQKRCERCKTTFGGVPMATPISKNRCYCAAALWKIHPSAMLQFPLLFPTSKDIGTGTRLSTAAWLTA